jgi:hypothetical protein
MKTFGVILLCLADPLCISAQQTMLIAPDSTTSPPADSGGTGQFGPAVRDLFLSELAPYSIDRWITKQPWARTSLRSWSDNLKYGWEWDTDHFVVNQFAHPYSGNMYFSSARSNGFSFWESAPFAMAGSAIWEYFGETTRPSVNDIINTTLGGISLGETTYRLSGMILDNQSTGTERTFREIGAALINPVRAFSRLLRGETGRVGPNPIDRLTGTIHGSADIGYQRVDEGPKNAPARGPNQAFANFLLVYGDPLAGEVANPFGAFVLKFTLATSGALTISEAEAEGLLAVDDLKKEERSNQRLALIMHYHYFKNLAFENGGQGFSAGLMSRYPIGERHSLYTQFFITGFAIAAVKSDYVTDLAALANETARNYDFGPGAGGVVSVQFAWSDL